MTNKLSMILIMLLLSACSQNDNDQFYHICDVCSQEPKTIFIDSIQISFTDLISPNSDGYYDRLYLIGMTPTKFVQLNEIFSKTSFKIYRDNSINNPVLTLNDQEIIFYGLDANGDYVGDGIYTYKLRLDDYEYTRLLGVYKSFICITDFNCDDSCSITSQDGQHVPYYYDPVFFCK